MKSNDWKRRYRGKLYKRRGFSEEHGFRPHYTEGAVEFVESKLKQGFVCLETGMGSSTLWLAQRCKSVISFEHTQPWYVVVKEELARLGLTNVDLRFDPAYPKMGLTSIDGPFDFISIDGRGRRKTLMQVHPLLKVGGHLVLDDSHRAYYDCGKQFLETMAWWRADFFSRPKECGGGVTGTTTVWRKV